VSSMSRRSSGRSWALKICMVSTYPPTRCGVAYYTKELVSTLRSMCKSAQILVLSDRLTKNDPSYPFLLLKRIIKNRPSIIHIQHEYLMYGFYGVPLLPFTAILRFLGYPIVVTLHSVIPVQAMDKKFFHRYGLPFLPVPAKKTAVILFTKLMCMLSFAVIVHTKICERILREQYHIGEAKVHVVRHGRRSFKIIPKEEAKQRLKLAGTNILLCAGFVKPDKGFEKAIEALKTPEFDGYNLIIAGAKPFKVTLLENQYVDYLHRLTRNLGLENRVTFIERFLDEEELQILFSAADVVYLPYKYEIAGASGIYCLARGFGKRIITSNVTRFSEDCSSEWNIVANELLNVYSKCAYRR